MAHLSRLVALWVCMIFLIAPSSMASEVEILDVSAQQTGENIWRFSVTLNHDDTGWDHYASVWRVLADDQKTILGERVLLHPHVNEMPFTRSQSGIEIPASMNVVYIQADDNVGEGQSQLYRFDLER